MYGDEMKPKADGLAGFKAKLEANKANVLLWSSFLILTIFVYHFLSDGDFSFLLTLGGMARCFALTSLTMKIVTQQSCAGISIKTLQMYALVFFFRLCSILVYEGYLPFDRSGDWLYQTVEVAALLLTLLDIYLVIGPYRATYTRHQDTFGMYKMVPSGAGIIWLVLPCTAMALLLHPSLNGNFFTDVAWTMACYLETMAMVPQLYLFSRKKSTDTVVESYTSHFVFALGFARFLHFLFWLSSYHELNDNYSGVRGIVGYIVLGMQFMQMVIMMNFFYYYLKSAATGGEMELPTHLSAV